MTTHGDPATELGTPTVVSDPTDGAGTTVATCHLTPDPPGGEPDPPGGDADLAPALGNLRTAIADTAYPLVLPSADDARRLLDLARSHLDAARVRLVVVGGTLITGGRGHYLGMLGGVLLLTALQILLAGTTLPYATRAILFGLVVLAAVIALRERTS